MDNLTRVSPDIKGLYATAPQSIPIGPSLVIRAFLLQREQGNLLIYSTNKITQDALEDKGGAVRHYMNHGHEASFYPNKIDTPTYIHQNDYESVKNKIEVSATFSETARLGDDFEIIPTPGHTPGSTCYLWDNGAHRILFTGDMLYLQYDRWFAPLLGSSNRGPYLKSLRRIRELDFDVLLPWVTIQDQTFYYFVSKKEVEKQVTKVIERMEDK